jgi:RimJ/RimL family protein N-acetyltransferase/GNAT superfamily N-acetyltransferase
VGLIDAMFNLIHTKRLRIRAIAYEDAEDLAKRRSNADVARFQNWTVPYTLSQAEELVASLAGVDGPTNDEWWMAMLTLTDTGKVVGDLAVRLTSEARSAELGYTLGRDHWGMGYATEAVEGMVAYLFEEMGVARVSAMLHPDNVASARVLERCGFLFEGHTKGSFWLGDECSDDWIYGLVRSDWEMWRDRPRSLPAALVLDPVTAENESVVYRLVTHKTQERLVAPVAASFADALFPEVVNDAPVVPWMRAIVADDETVGFVMVALRTKHHREPFLWRLLIDRLHQRRGIGGRVLDLIADECRAMGDSALLTSWSDGPGSPGPFYLGHGFQLTGNIVDGETEGRRVLGT